MNYYSLGHRLPHMLSAPLFGDRDRFGCVIQEDDPDWTSWQDFYINFYQNTQKKGIGKVVNDAGYAVLNAVDMNGKSVLEIGPGILPHYQYWKGKPSSYTIVDNLQPLLDQSRKILEDENISVQSHLVNSYHLPISDESFDLVITFFSLEHLHQLDDSLDEMIRVLKSGGTLVGAIPCEGGLAWGFGRFVTSRPYIKRNSSINPDKIICWEHPNFAEEILNKLDSRLKVVRKDFWPFRVPVIDINLIANFVYKKS